MARESRTEFEVRSYELDAYRHVNHAVVASWFEQARLCWLRDRGLTYESVPESHGVHVVVVRQDVTYKRQLRLGERLVATTRVVRVGTSSFTFDHVLALADGGAVAATATVTMVCVGPDGSSTPVPHALRELFGS
jgi:YbgC/YbaW family acyl-CoA thioester hydrolase